MFRKLREMFGKEGEPPLSIAFGDIPGWLDHETENIRKSEEEKVSASREQVLLAIEALRELVENLGTGNHEGTGIPKLEKVAENSLPLYKKAMLSALSRQFPEKPEEFYHAVTECLKGCLKSSQGPGRYLVRVFPEEMKSIKTSVGLIGREINLMNPVFTESGKNRIALEQIRKLHDSVLRIRSEQASAEKEYPELLTQANVLAEETRHLSDQIALLNNNPEMNVFNGLISEEKNLVAEQDRLAAEFASLGSIIVHVMKRAEKVAQKNRKEPVIKKAHILVDLLSKTELPAQDDLLPVLAEVLPPVIEMVSLGDIALRNREEEQYFNSPDILPARISTLYERIQGTNADITRVRHNIGENTFIREKELLEKRYKFKKAELAGKERKAADTRQRLEECKAQVPDLLIQLKKELAAYTGQDVSLPPP